MESVFKLNQVNLLKIIAYFVFIPLKTFVLVLLLSIVGISSISTPVGNFLSLILGLIALFLLFNLFNKKNLINLNIKPVSIKKILFIIPLALFIRLPFLLVVFLPFIPNDPETISQSLNQFSFSSNNFDLLGNILTVISVALLAPILEELFFRGVIFNTLRNRYSVLVSIIASSCLFSLVHGNIILITTSFIHGLIFAYIYYRYKNILYAITLHSFSNIIPLLFALF